MDNRLAWMRQMLDWQKEVSDAREFVENVKGDLFGDLFHSGFCSDAAFFDILSKSFLAAH